MKLHFASVLAVTALLTPHISEAKVESLNWEDALKETTRNNPDLRAARETFRSYDFQVNAAYANFFPQLSASANYSYGTSSTSSLTTSGASGSMTSSATSVGFGTSSASATSYYSLSLSASEALFTGFQDYAKVGQAKGTRDAYRANFNIVRAKVGNDLKTTFAAMMYAQNSVELSDDITQRREENLRMVELRFESGRENKGSVLLSKAYLNQARFEALQARDAIQVAREQLAKILGREQSEAFSVTGTVPTHAPGPPLDLHGLALGTPEYQQASAQEKAADAAVTLARAGFFPTLSLTATTGRTGDDWYPQNSRWSVGLGLTVPLFNGGRDFYGTKSALETHNAAVSNQDVVKHTSETKLAQTWAGYTEAVEKLKVDQSFADAAKVREEIGRNKYNSGLLSFEDWDLIENDLIARQKALLQTKRDRITAESAWEQAQGLGPIAKEESF